jgi:tRNA(fMet)-specific endonuclease VapC
MIHLDTSFVVDLLREQRRDKFGPASEFLESLDADEEMAVSVHVVCELMAGASVAGTGSGESERLARVCDALLIRYPDAAFAPRYGRLLAGIRRAGTSVDTMDLLIATAAVVDEAPLVTRNARHFTKVPGLEVLTY